MPSPRLALAVALAVAVVVAAAVVASDGSDGPRDAATPGGGADDVRRLSNEWTRSRWAHVRSPTLARRGPAPTAAPVKRIALRTAVDTPEVVLALAERRGADGRLWTRIRVPMRPANRTGWVPRDRLGRYHVVTTAMRIDRAGLTAVLYDRGRVVWRAPIAVGTDAHPTPAGHFYVRSRIIPTEGGVIEPDGFYGVYAFGTSGYAPNLSDWPGGGEVGIHGTNRPDLVPGRVSHGCVRIRNAKIARLRELMPLGTPVEIVG